jgi:D-alanine-D-alanine ligase
MDKTRAKAVLAAAGVSVPGGGLFPRLEAGRRHVMAPPYVVKPNAQGSSVGVFRVFEGANQPPEALLADDWEFGEEVLVEPYVPGLELAVAVMGDPVNDLLVLLEVNTQPGMTPTSLAPEQGAHVGLGFDDLVLWITEDAHARGGARQRTG